MIAIALVGGGAAGACRGASAFACTQSDECGAQGVCEPSGFCSFPDGECPSGQRYGDHAPGSVAGVCVPVGEASSGDDEGPPVGTSSSGASSGASLDTTSGESSSATTVALTSGAESSSSSSSSGEPVESSSDTGVPLDPDLVLWYRFETDPARGVVDEANGLHGECEPGECPVLAPGAVGSGIHLDGEDDVVRRPHDALLDTTEAFTFAFFINPDVIDDSVVASPISRPFGPTTQNSYEIYLRNSGVGTPLRMNYVMTGDASAAYLQTEPPPAGEWTHVGVTWDGAVVRLWVNGVEVDSATATSVQFDDNDFLVGADRNDGLLEGFFDGALDEVRIYSRALTADEIAVLAEG